MFRTLSLLLLAVCAIVVFDVACKKSSSTAAPDPGARTVANLSNSYKLTALRVTAPIDSNAYDALDTCDKDNLTVLSTDLSLKVEDVGEVCSPSADTTGSWSLSPKADSIYINGSGELIKSWDGTTLVLDGTEAITNSGFTLMVSTEATFTKQKQ